MSDQEYVEALKLVANPWIKNNLRWHVGIDKQGRLILKDKTNGQIYGSNVVSRFIEEGIGWVTIIGKDEKLTAREAGSDLRPIIDPDFIEELDTDDGDFDEQKAIARIRELTGADFNPAPEM